MDYGQFTGFYRWEFKVAAYEDYERLASLQAQSWKMFYLGVLEPKYLDLDILADRRAVWQTRLINPPIINMFCCLKKVITLRVYMCIQ